MKIKQIMLKNFANVNQIEINLSDSVTYLIGENGSGKTTVGLNAIWFILEGLSLKGKKVLHGDRFRFIGTHGKSAIGQLVLHDEVEDIEVTIQRKLLKNKTELKITASDKRQLSANFIDDIFNIFSINPMGFAKLAPQEQAEALGVDTSENEKLKRLTSRSF
jgi:recombinational DNA repair ATPase RecF